MDKNKNDAQEFGGPWTEEKIELLRKYLSAYTEALKSKPTANNPFKLLYIDAFAGTGHYHTKRTEKRGGMLGGKEQFEVIEKKDGSAKVALSLNRPFSKYIFIDTDEEKIAELQEITKLFPNLCDRVELKKSDATIVLENICNNTNWRAHRAVLFLDPFGLQVPWSTVEKIAKTQFIDMWFLFPISAINRMLTKNGAISDAWSNKLTTVFGTDGWRQHFYTKSKQLNMWDTDTSYQKDASFKKISDYFYFVTLPITLPFVCRVNGCLPLPVPDTHLPEDLFLGCISPWKKMDKQGSNVRATEQWVRIFLFCPGFQQEEHRHHHHGHMMMPGQPAPDLIMIHAGCPLAS